MEVFLMLLLFSKPDFFSSLLDSSWYRASYRSRFSRGLPSL